MRIEPRRVKLTTRTSIEISRTIPHARLKTIGAWCFIDHFGPTEQTEPMVVAAHPHSGLQTVTWLFEGRIEHRDSVGSVQLITPGQVNLMTAGKGISHSELSLEGARWFHGVQLWVALPKQSLDIDPFFEHIEQLPRLAIQGLKATVLVGEFMGHAANATTFTPLMGVELVLEPGTHKLPVDAAMEHGLMLIDGDVVVADQGMEVSSLHYFAAGRAELEVIVSKTATMMLLGGEPLQEKILMWWNFIGRTHEDIALARSQWNSREDRFGSFEDNVGGWIPAPDLPNIHLKPR
jgi:redox-sensitive bicupin YhaK (pirin superfamily)